MKVLIVCSGTHGILSPYIKEQMDSLSKLGIEFLLFQINKKGLFGYLSHLNPLNKFIKKHNPDLIHAHYGLSGLLANMQRRVPIVTTFHGSDINNLHTLKFSKWAHKFSAASIFVEETMERKMTPKKRSFIIPCGVDITTFYPISKDKLVMPFNVKTECVNILFSSAFGNSVKNYTLAKEACLLLEKKINKKVEIIELKGYSRQQVNLLMNSVDCALLTSFSEGSPQFIKEAMACSCPIVATNVGDIKWLIGETDECHLTSFDPNDVAEKLKLTIECSKNNGSTKGRERIIELGLDSETVAKKIINIYSEIA